MPAMTMSDTKDDKITLDFTNFEAVETTTKRGASLTQIRHQIAEKLHSRSFHIAVIVLVIVDALIVVGALVLEIEELKVKAGHHELLVAESVLHYGSLSILSFFMVELGLKIFAMGLEFFTHKLEVFDGIVIVISFALDIAMVDNKELMNALGLIIILRLWRVVRILNAIVLSVRARDQEKLDAEKEKRVVAEQELNVAQTKLEALRAQVTTLENLLAQHNIPLPKEAVVDVDLYLGEGIEENSMLSSPFDAYVD